jgi:hypothetical protein
MKRQKSNVKFIDISQSEFHNEKITDNEKKNIQNIDQVFQNNDKTESIHQEEPKLIKRVRFSSKISILYQNDNDYVWQDLISQLDDSSISSETSNSFRSKLKNKILNVKTRFLNIKNRPNKKIKYKQQLLKHSRNQISDYKSSSFDNNQSDFKFIVTSL